MSREDCCILFSILCTKYLMFLFFGSLFNSYVNIAVCSLINDAAQTVANPNKDGTTAVAVDTPIAFCAAVDTARLVPNATHPPTTENAASGMRVQRSPNEKSKDVSSLLSPSPIGRSDRIYVLERAEEDNRLQIIYEDSTVVLDYRSCGENNDGDVIVVVLFLLPIEEIQ